MIPINGPTYLFESLAPPPVAGVDEVGRGPMAGPVVAAAVILRPSTIPDGLADSKTLKPAIREELCAALYRGSDIGVGAASVSEIDSINILPSHVFGDASSGGKVIAGPKVGAGRWQPDAEASLSAAPGRQRGWAMPVDRCGIHRCKGGARSHDGAACRALSGLRMGAQCGLLHASAPQRTRGVRCDGASSPILPPGTAGSWRGKRRHL